jgi:ribonuclease HI
LLVKAGKRKWSDEAWQFQLSLSEETNIEANLTSVVKALEEAREVEQKIMLGYGVSAR